MSYPHLRATYPKYANIADDGAFLVAVHQGEFPTASEDSFSKAASMIEKEGTAAPTPAVKPNGSLPTTPAGVYNAATNAVTKVAGAAAGVVKSAATDLSNIPRGLVADPLAQVFQNRAATPEEEKRSFSGLAGLTGLLTAPGITEAAGMGMAKLGGPKLLQKILAGAGSGALLGGGDAAIRSGWKASAIPYGMASGTVAGGAFGAMLPGYRAPIGPVAAPLTDTASQEWHAGLENDALHPGMKIGGGLSPANKARVTKNAGALESLYGGAQEAAQEAPPKGLGFQKQRALEGLYGRGKPPRVLRVPFETTASADLPMNLKSQVARSPLGPVVSSVTDRMRAMGPVGQAMDDMIEQVARQSQEEPGNHLQPFDEALHAVTGRKGKLAPEARRSLLAAFQGRLDPQKLAPNLQPLYQQAKDYFKGTVQRGTKLGATVQRGEKRVPLAQAQIEHYFPQRAVTVDALKGDSDLRAAIAHNLEDQGLAKTPQEAQAILDDHIAFVESKGKRGGQLAIGAMKGLNPEMSPAQLKNALLYSKPPLRMPGGSLEFSRTVNSPFYDPRPETVFPQHVVDTERALAEIEHYGQDASKLTGKMLELPSEHQQEMQHLVRTATESHAPWDPRLTGFLGKLRTAQLGLFTPQTSVKNLSQRANNLLTSDVSSFAKRGMLAGKGAAKIGARSGARAEGAHETLAQALGTKSGAGERWLNLIGFTQAERGNRNTGAATGLDEAQKYAARLGKNPNDALAQSRLAREGINPQEVQGGALTRQQENRAALARSNKAQFRSHPKDLPDWFTSNPVTRTAALFKGFDYQQTRLMLDETLGRIASHAPGDKARGLRNLGIVATVYPVIGEGVNDIYGVISRKETPAHVAQRTKEFIHDTGQVVSGEMNPVDYAAKYKARYGADLLAGSAPGAGGVLATTLQYGKGDKGGGLVKQAVGPAISRPAEAVQLAHDALTQKKASGEDKPMTPAQRREALRLILGGAGSTAGSWLYPDTHSAGNHAQ